ncbi:MAG: hypothetical protein KatS3mg061_1117 [Dehalococcoidia bacterium]|nr:MAG: hypothetical protein KatS3mg061_1117 [Dehalococcoidia bacterium]
MAQRVMVAMSGGVDSSVAAALLLEQGYEVVGVTMRLWTKERPDAPPHHRGCCSIEETDDARRVAGLLGFPYYVLNFEREFERTVVDTFVTEYTRGRTPNPCLACNQFLKFDLLLRRARALGCDYLATGHYARIREQDGRFHLLKAVDAGKDQSYVLYPLGQRELAQLLLPIGHYPKSEVRAIAARLGLPVAGKPDSQEICFLQGQDYRDFLRERLGAPAHGRDRRRAGAGAGLPFGGRKFYGRPAAGPRGSSRRATLRHPGRRGAQSGRGRVGSPAVPAGALGGGGPLGGWAAAERAPARPGKGALPGPRGSGNRHRDGNDRARRVR